MKLSMACVVAALSLSAAACADEVPTSGDSEISVKDTGYKATQDPKTRSLRPGGSLADQLTGVYDSHLIRFSAVRGMTAEELPPRAMDHDTSGMTKTPLSPSIAPAPFHPDRAMNTSTDGLTTSSLAMAMNQETADIGLSDVTNGMSHPKAGIQSVHAVLIVQHDNDGTIDTATVFTEDGTEVCQVVQTSSKVLSNNCP